jgi:diaminohydroxyphosphoribosylaminopyrimidine deaminase/5-amino-6-(5-phosphoribosylamino)uracil reductase
LVLNSLKALSFIFRALVFCYNDLLKTETKYMRKAINLAKKGAGWVNPNPMVGAVLVKDGRIIGEGYHEFFGGPHAEVNAINSATESVDGATLYVTLEPCTHHGKTPPCAPLLREKEITRIVIGISDPNPEVNGKGIQYLLSEGIVVETGVLEKEITRMNEAFIKFTTTGTPFCILKTAMTLDGKIATVSNASKWISGEQSRKYVHELRQQVSGLMVGVDTVIYDDPLLNTRRSNKKSKDPLKIITDTRCRIPMESKALTCNPQLTILATTDLADKTKLKEIERLGCQIIICPVKDDKVDLAFLVQSLGIMGIDSILIEGGSMLAYSALTEQIVDKVTNFISPKILGGKLAPTPVGGEGIGMMNDAIQVLDWKIRKIGEDFLIEGYIKN